MLTRPFASDITVAKSDVLCLMEKVKQRYFKKDDNGVYEKKFKDSVKGLQFFSHELSSIAHHNNIEYGDISRYCLSLIKKILKRELDCKNIVPTEGQLLSFVEMSFFVFSLDMSMSNSVKMAKIIDIIVDISDKLEDSFHKQNVKDRLCREFKRCLDIYISTAKNEQTNIDIINLLLVIQRKLSLKISDEMIRKIFNLGNGPAIGEGYRKLDYFQICAILCFLENNNSPIYCSLIQEVKERFKVEKPLLYSELTLLYFDVLSCPLVKDVDKLEIIYNIYKKRDQQRLADVSGIKRWFFDWDKNKNISNIIEKKEYIPAYQ